MIRTDLIAALVALGPEALALTIVNALEPAGTEAEWDSETVEWVVRPLDELVQRVGGPAVGTDTRGWECVAYGHELPRDADGFLL